MRKILTLYKKNPKDLSRVINEIDPDNAWVFTDEGVKATRKFDGTSCAIIDGVLHRRYDVKKGKSVPNGAIPCQDPDPITGHWPHWVRCDYTNPADIYHFEALKDFDGIPADGTYELCGPKIQGNPEQFDKHTLVLPGSEALNIPKSEFNFEFFMGYLQGDDIEGIVFHHPDGRMCKLRKSDYGIKR